MHDCIILYASVERRVKMQETGRRLFILQTVANVVEDGFKVFVFL